MTGNPAHREPDLLPPRFIGDFFRPNPFGVGGLPPGGDQR